MIIQFVFSNHGVADYIFFITCHDKNTCHERKKTCFSIFFMVFLGNFFGTIHHHHMCINILHLYTTFVHDSFMYIHIIYINACIHQGLNSKLHGDAPRF
jgi:hypothetical protein